MATRREFLQLSALACAVSGIVTIRNQEQGRDRLVIQLDMTQQPLSKHQVVSLTESLRKSGLLDAVVLMLPRGSSLGKVGSPATFRHFMSDHGTRVFDRSGSELEKVRWADSESGLVCQIENHRDVVRQYEGIHFSEV